MRKDGEWADRVEIQAAADYYGVNINVFTAKHGAKKP